MDDSNQFRMPLVLSCTFKLISFLCIVRSLLYMCIGDRF